jgi:hypothetical protein
VLGVHHLEGHLLSPLLATERPAFPFIALLVSGGHTQLMRVDGVGRYTLLGETLDDAAGEAFDKSAKLLGLGYPGGPAISRLAEFGDPEAYKLPRPMLHSKDFNFSFSGLKTAVLTVVKNHEEKVIANICEQDKANIARGFVDAIVDVLTAKCVSALRHTGLKRLVIAGGVGANASCALAERGGGEEEVQGLLSGARILHRQRRDDRLCRRPAPGAQSAGRRAITASTCARAGRWTNALAADEAEEHRPQVAEEDGDRNQRDAAVVDAVRSPNCTASHTASQPLAPSPTRVAIAAFLLPLRRTLVAPGFFEP